jgi:hypothetical protein
MEAPSLHALNQMSKSNPISQLQCTIPMRFSIAPVQQQGSTSLVKMAALEQSFHASESRHLSINSASIVFVPEP